MAASTLHSFLIRLGFDIAGLRQGGAEGRRELHAMAKAAQELASAAGPASPAVNAIGNAAAGAAPKMALFTSSAQAAQMAMKAQYAAAGPLVTANQAAAQSMQQAYAAAGPLVAGIRGAGGAMAAGAPQANLAAAGFVNAGRGAAMAAGGMGGVPGPALRAAMSMNTVAAAATHVAERSMFMSRVLSMAFAFSGGVAVTTLFGFLANAVLGFNSRLEQARIAFTTLLGSAGEADAFIAKMERFAELTPFNFQGVEEAAQRLMAMGFTVDQILPTLTAVGDAVAALGGNTEKLDRITIALGQMATAGRVNAQDMRQLTEAGIPAWQMLADGIGKSVAQTRKLAEEGLIPANQALTILVNSMETRFGGMMARQARTAQGAFSTIRDVALQTISSAVEPLFQALSQGMLGLVDFLLSGGGRYVAPTIQAIGVALTAFLIPALYRAAAASAAVTVSMAGIVIPIFPLIIALTTLGIAWQENVGGIRETIGPLIGQVAQLANGVLRLATGSGLLTPIIIALAVAITTRFVVGLTASLIAMVANIAAAIGLRAALSTLTPAAAGAGASMLGFSVATSRAAMAVAALMLPLTLLAIAGALLVLNFDRVAQGTRVLHIGLIGLQKAVVDLLALLPGPQQDLFKGMSESFQRSIDAIKRDMASAEADIQRKKREIDEASKPAESSKALDLKFSSSGAGEVLGAAQKLVDTYGTMLEGVVRAAGNAGAEAMMEMAKGIQSTAGAPADAFKQAMEIQKTALSKQEQIARDVGILQSAELAQGVRSQIPEVAAAWIAVQKAAVDNLNRNTGGAFEFGAGEARDFWLGVEKGIKEGRITGRFAVDAQPYIDLVKAWDSMRPSAKTAQDALAALTAEIKTGATTASNAAAAYLDEFGSSMQAVVEAGKTAGGQFMAEYAKGIAQNADAPLNAMKDLIAMQKAEMTRGAQESRLIGILISKQLADGMSSSSPAVVAQAIATTNFIMDELNRLQPGAYAAGSVMIQLYAQGMISPQAFAAINKAAAAIRYALAVNTMVATGDFSGYSQALSEYKNAINLVVPSFNGARAAANDFFRTIDSGSKSSTKSFATAMADAKDLIRDAFGEIKRAARSYFDEIHDNNLKAIQDAHDLAEALLDEPANAYRAQITAERAIRREAELRKALAEAKTPQEQYEAQQNLVDFLQDQELNRLEEAAEAAKKLNDQKLAEQKAAENKRYTEQVAAFNAELATLQKYMLRHPEEWRRMQASVLALLAKYGITYVSAGAELGAKFADGLRKSVKKAQDAAEDLAIAAAKAFNSKFKAETGVDAGKPVPTPPPVPKPGAGGVKVPQAQGGMWKVLEDNLLASLHSDEMVAPAHIAGLLRTIAQGPIATGRRPTFGSLNVSAGPSAAGSGASSRLGGERPDGGNGGGGTLLIMMDGDVLARHTDERLAIRENVTVVMRPGSRE